MDAEQVREAVRAELRPFFDLLREFNAKLGRAIDLIEAIRAADQD